MKTYLVTGAAGFIGSNFINELKNIIENEAYRNEMLLGYEYVAERLGPAGAPCHAAHGIVKLLKK